MNKIKFAAQLAAAICVTTALAAGALAAGAAELADIGGHWSKDYVEYGVSKGYINGYPDGTFKPDASVTRAEFSKMLNSALGITKKSDISFFDVEEDEWYYPEIQKAVYAGYVNGYENGAFMASNLITREEAAVILSRVATRADRSKSLSSYKDADQISDWAEEAFRFTVSKGFMTGDDVGLLTPKASLTRSQAAKIIYILATGENIQNGTYTVKPDNALCSETIFTDDVVFSSTADDASLTLDGCRVLGSVKIKTSRPCEVTVKDSSLALLESSGAFAEISADDSTVTTVKLETPAALSGKNYGNVYLTGRQLSSGTTELNASPDKVIISAGAVLRCGTLNDVEITSRASVLFQNGNLEKLLVSSGAAGSVVTLADSVNVEQLTVNASASFMGSGSIESARNNASGISYETKPDKLTGIGSDDDGDDKNDSFEPDSVSPSSASDDVSVSTSISIYFDRTIYDEDGDTPTSSYLEDCFELRRGSSSGTKVSFTAGLASTRRRVTISPDSDLAADTRYYIILKSGVFTDAKGNENARFSSSFTTKDSVSQSITFSPQNGEKDVSVSDPFKITFRSAVYDSDGDTATTSYLSREAIELREKSSTGDKVAISASLSSTKRILTVTPEEALKPDTRYYLIITSGSLEYSDGTNVPRTISYFTTSDDLDVVITPASGATGVAPDGEIELRFNTEIYRPSGSNVTTSYLSEQAIELRRSSSSGTKVNFTAVLSSDRKTVRLIPDGLEAGTRYYVIIPSGKLANENGTENDRITSYFNTANAMTPAFTPLSGSDDVAVSDDIVIRFTDELYDKDKKHITPEYVAEKVVTLKKSSSTGASVPFDVRIDSNYRAITITPKTPFSANTTYYVSVARSTLYNESGKANVSGSATFRTAYSNTPDFLPYNGETEVDVATTVQITFDRKMYAIGGNELTTTYVKNNVVELYKENYDGAAVSFNVTLSADKQTITLKPTSKLTGDTNYFVVVRKGSLEDSSGNENALYTASFTTAENVSTDVTVTPDNRASGISVNTSVVVAFESSVYRPGGSVASNAYLTNNVFELRKGSSSSGKKIECTASLDSENKVVTLTPTSPLEPSTTYYVRILSGTLEYGDGVTKVSAKTSSFTTNNGKPVVTSFTIAEIGASYVVAEVKADTDGEVTVTAYGSGEETATATADVKAGELTRVTVTGLASNRSYTVAAFVKDSSGASSTAKSVTAKTLTPFSFDIKDVTDSSFTVSVDALCDGVLDLRYTNKKTGRTETRVTGLFLEEGTKGREFAITGLDSRTEYEVTLVFTDAYDGSFTSSDRVTTPEPQKEVLAITSLRLADANGDIYTADIKDGKAAFTIEKSSFVKLTGESSVANASFTYNGGTAVKPGSASQSIIVEPGKVSKISVVLTSADTGASVSCEVTVTVNG